MKILGVTISKRKVTLALIEHGLEDISLEPKSKQFKLLRLQYLYIPRNVFEKITDLFYRFDKLDIVEQCDFVRIVYEEDPETSSDTNAVKKILYLLLKDQLKKIKKKYYVESQITMQYRMGKTTFMGHKKVLDWILKNVSGINRQQLMGRKGILIQSVLAIASGCSQKSSKYNW